MFTLQPGLGYGGYNVHLRLAAGDIRPGLDHLAATWTRFVPDRPLDFAFLDDRIEQLYQAEQRLVRIFGLFSGLAILVACLGLLGLASFTAEQRTREIGIRKVLGATIGQILVLLCRDYVRLVLIGYVLAVPVIYIVMNRWLASFAYHVDVGPGVFLAVGLAMLVLALATVGFQSVRAARSDPARALRHE
jgi:putative ABC transport system permease protein